VSDHSVVECGVCTSTEVQSSPVCTGGGDREPSVGTVDTELTDHNVTHSNRFWRLERGERRVSTTSYISAPVTGGGGQTVNHEPPTVIVLKVMYNISWVGSRFPALCLGPSQSVTVHI